MIKIKKKQKLLSLVGTPHSKRQQALQTALTYCWWLTWLMTYDLSRLVGCESGDPQKVGRSRLQRQPLLHISQFETKLHATPSNWIVGEVNCCISNDANKRKSCSCAFCLFRKILQICVCSDVWKNRAVCHSQPLSSSCQPQRRWTRWSAAQDRRQGDGRDPRCCGRREHKPLPTARCWSSQQRGTFLWRFPKNKADSLKGCSGENHLGGSSKIHLSSCQGGHIQDDVSRQVLAGVDDAVSQHQPALRICVVDFNRPLEKKNSHFQDCITRFGLENDLKYKPRAAT